MQCRFSSKEPWQGGRKPLSGEHPGTPQGRQWESSEGEEGQSPSAGREVGNEAGCSLEREEGGKHYKTSLTCLFLLSYGLSGFTFHSLHRDRDLLSPDPG